MRTRATAVALCVSAYLLAGCLGADGAGEAPGSPIPSREDSSLNFKGEEREVAEVVERFEAAVLEDDVETICDDLLAVQEIRGDRKGESAFCVLDPENQPSGMLAAIGDPDAYDLVVKKVRRDGAIHGRDRFRALVRDGSSAIEFTIQRFEDAWLITSRDFSVDGESTRLAGEFDCDKGGSSELGVSFAGPSPRTNDPRKAILQGPFGERARSAIEDGGSLTLDSVFYRPDYHFMYTLADKRGRVIVRYPVSVFGPRELDASSMTFCRGDGQTGIVIV